MELPTLSSLTLAEAEAKILYRVDDGPEYYTVPILFRLPNFRAILQLVRSLPKRCVKDGDEYDLDVWNDWLNGYRDWAIPIDSTEIDAFDYSQYMSRRMRAERMFNGSNREEDPERQMQALFAAPIIRGLQEFSMTEEFKALGDKLYVLKIEISPLHTFPVEDYYERLKGEVKVWRLVTCFGDINLHCFHDQIIAPAMGWRRHFHSFKFIMPGNGALFGVADNSMVAVDMMHCMRVRFLDSTKYDVRHVLRKPGDRLGYVYDLGDTWKHIITVLDVVERGTTLNHEVLRKADPQIAAYLDQQTTRPTWIIQGNHLLAGEMNCPPEDSTGCADMGYYSDILKLGPAFRPTKLGINWEEHGIRCAYDFDLKAHQQRFDKAVREKPSPMSGNLRFNHIGPGAAQGYPEVFATNDPKNKMQYGRTINESSIEEVRRKSITKDQCVVCGKQKGVNSGIVILICSRCQGVAYCGRVCQKQDWKSHKKICVPAETTTSSAKKR